MGDRLIIELKRLLNKIKDDPSIAADRRRHIEKTILYLLFLLSSGAEKIPQIAQKRREMPSKSTNKKSRVSLKN